MKPAYRIVHFTPNPLGETRFALGAVVFDGSRVRVARTPHVPGEMCIGRARDAALAHHLIEELHHIRSLDSLLSYLGPLVNFGDVHALPEGLEIDALEWVAKYVLAVPRSPRSGARRGPRRTSYGLRFFKTWHIDSYMKNRYQPADDWGGWLRTQFPLRSVSHWVADDSRIMLVEPLVPSLPAHEEHLVDVGEKFSSYRLAMQNHDSRRRGELCALILAGGAPDVREKMIRNLREIAHRVVDSSERSQTSGFVSLVKELGTSGNGPVRNFVYETEQAEVRLQEGRSRHEDQGRHHRRAA